MRGNYRQPEVAGSLIPWKIIETFLFWASGLWRECIRKAVCSVIFAVSKSYIFRDITPCTVFENQLIFRRRISPPSSVPKNKPREKQT
jgi:hypothetical protein